MSARLWLAAAATWLAAGLWRLRCLDQVSVGSDSLGSFLAAWSAAPGHLPMPPNPEAGFSLWVTAWPLVQLAGSLEGLFALRFWQAALIAPLVLLATWRLTRDLRAAALAAALVVFDSGLVDTLVSSFRGYGAPELVAAATLGAIAAQGGSRLGLAAIPVALVAASGQHPFATGAALGVLTALPWLKPRRGLLAAAALGAVCCLPRLWWIGRLADCPDGPAACLSTVAWGSAEGGMSRLALLLRAVGDRSTELGLATVPISIGVIAALWSRRGAAAWALGVLGGVLLLGLSVQSLRPYHLRIAAAPLAVAAAAGWLRLGRAGWGLGLLAVGLTAAAPLPLGDPGALRRHDALGRQLRDAAPAWVDGAWGDGGPIVSEPSGVALSAVLQGAEPEALRPAPQRRLMLLVSDGTAEGSVRWFDSAAEARAWIDGAPALVGAGVAGDWLGALFPGAPQPAGTQLSVGGGGG